MLVSIILPVYNAEKCLSRSIDSVLAQSFEDYELLLINDGSTDGSEEICRQYAGRDARVKYLPKANGGASDTRNYGLRCASSPYIAFIDADDYADADWLQNMVDAMGDADLVIQGYYRHDGDAARTKKLQMETISRSDYSAACDRLLRSTSLGYIWSMLFKSSIIKDHQIAFNTTMKLQEDLDFVLRYLVHVESFKTIDSVSYHYNYTDKQYCYTTAVANTILSDMRQIINDESMEYWRGYYETEILFSYLRNLDEESFADVKAYMKSEELPPFSAMSKLVKLIITNTSFSLAKVFLTPVNIIHNIKNK